MFINGRNNQLKTNEQFATHLTSGLGQFYSSVLVQTGICNPAQALETLSRMYCPINTPWRHLLCPRKLCGGAAHLPPTSDTPSKTTHFIAWPKLPTALTIAEPGSSLGSGRGISRPLLLLIPNPMHSVSGSTMFLNRFYTLWPPITWNSHFPWGEYAHDSLTCSATGLSTFDVSLDYQQLSWIFPPCRCTDGSRWAYESLMIHRPIHQ